MFDWNAGKILNVPAGLFIDGQWTRGEGGASFSSLDPTTGEVFAHVTDADAREVDTAIGAAVRAQPGWAALPPAARAAMFYEAAELFKDRQDQFAQALIRETGSGHGKAMFECSQIPLALREVAGLATRDIGEILPSQVPGKYNRTYRTPAGVIGVITPWNFPLYLSIRGIVYALALGNTVVLKPSEDSPVTGGLMIAELFADAGFPAGVLNVVTTSRDRAPIVGEAFIKDPRVKVISFTGSTKVGQMLATACAPIFKPMVLELGGKNPTIIMEDADIDRAVDVAFFGKFLHQGQICMSCDKVLVARPVYDTFLEKLVAKTRNFAPTNPADQTCVIGPMINERALQRVKAMVDEAVAKGAKVHCGGNSKGPYYEPTVLSAVTSEMAVWIDEIFGPVVTVTPFDTVGEAVAMANDTPYGLSASIVTANPMIGEMLAERIHAGMVHVNDSTVHDEPHAPFGGLGASGGGGRWGPKGAIEAYTVQRWIATQREPRALPF